MGVIKKLKELIKWPEMWYDPEHNCWFLGNMEEDLAWRAKYERLKGEGGTVTYMESPDAVAEPAAVSIASAAVVITYKAVYPCEVYELQVIPVALQSAGPAVVALNKVPLVGSAQNNLATVTISATAAAGSVWRNDLQKNAKTFKLNIGDTLQVQVTTIGSGTAYCIPLIRRSAQPVPALAVATYNEVSA